MNITRKPKFLELSAEDKTNELTIGEVDIAIQKYRTTGHVSANLVKYYLQIKDLDMLDDSLLKEPSQVRRGI